ncbi:MAG: helix-turn-helix domain-containing protein [Chloroflexi bacterium]|nr:helix-turn-helix domain-containing protein [Chloroflexota bacterium]
MMSEMLTAKEIQDLLHVDRSTVYRMAEDGRLPAMKVGRQWRFPAEQIDGWMKEQGTAVTTPPTITSITNQQQTDFSTQIPIACVQLIQDTFADALGIMIIITDMDGNAITQFSNPCGLFTALSDTPILWQKCMAHWREMAADLSLEPQFMSSYLGLLCARGFIRVGTELQGMVFIGGVAPHRWPILDSEIDTIASELDVAPELIQEHLQEVFYLEDDRRQEVLSFVQRIANIVSHILHERQAMMA